MSYVAKCDYCQKVATGQGTSDSSRYGGLPKEWKCIAPYDADKDT